MPDADRRGKGRTVLCAFPGDRDPQHALSVAVQLAHEHAARLTLAAIVDEIPVGLQCAGPWTHAGPGYLRQDMLDDAWHSCLRALRSVPRDMTVDHRVVCGRPTHAIAALVDSESPSVLVIGASWATRRAMRRSLRRWTAAAIDVRTVAEGQAWQSRSEAALTGALDRG